MLRGLARGGMTHGSGMRKDEDEEINEE